MSIVKKYYAEVVNFENPIDNIFCVEMKSIENKKFIYQPGQFLHFSLEEYDPSFQWPESRCFSMQSSPSEQNVRITFAVKGKYSEKMSKEINIGKIVSLKMPFGNFFSQTNNKNNCLFIAGGTGITPFLSLFTDESFESFINPKLYFGLKNEKYYIYKNDIEKIKNNSFVKNIKFENIDGILDIESIFNENGINSTYFISGSFVMIKIFKKYLTGKDVLETSIITDEWE